MPFDLEKFFVDIFKPQRGDIVTFMTDVPHGNIADDPAWKETREMAAEWQNTIAQLANKFGITVNPLVSYSATGSGGAGLPATAMMGNETVDTENIVSDSNIIISMPKFSATAPLSVVAQKTKKQRVCSMPGVIKDMENTGLSADYLEISRKCKAIGPYFEKAIGAEVEFSTGHKCYFDISADQEVHLSDGLLWPDRAPFTTNLPGGEVYTVPNEAPGSKTCGELPQKFNGELVVYVVKENKIVDVKGDGPKAKELKEKFKADTAWQNIAEFAIGCNDKAKIRGITLEDEKAGFHWAYGRSDHFGGNVGVKDFKTTVIHQDVIYAKGCPIECKSLVTITTDGKRDTLIVNAELLV